MLKFEYSDDESTLARSIFREDMTWDEAFQYFFEFLGGCGYIFPKEVNSFDELINIYHPVPEVHEEFKNFRPMCSKPQHIGCPARLDSGECETVEYCIWKESNESME